MILEEETFDAFGYYPKDLKSQSGKPIIAACELCGKFRSAPKSHYHTFCNSCSRILNKSQKGKKHPLFGKHSWNFGKSTPEKTKALISAAQKGKVLTEEHKAKISAAEKGNRNGLNYKHTKEAKALMHAAKKGKKNPWFGKFGKDAPNFKGGKRIAQARTRAKRKRALGYTLLIPLVEGEVGHHVTDNQVLGIPTEVHQRFSGYSRRKHRTLVLQWLKANDKKKYELVLCILAKQPLKQDK